jgi:hypothetical protein
MDLSKLKEGTKPATKKKTNAKPLLSSNDDIASAIDLYKQGADVEKQGKELKNEVRHLITGAYIDDLFDRNEGSLTPCTGFTAQGTSVNEKISVYSHDRYAEAELQQGVETDPRGEAIVKELKKNLGPKYKECFDEVAEVTISTSDVPESQREKFLLDVISVLNNYRLANGIKKVLRFSSKFRTERHAMLTPEENKMVNEHMNLSIIIR